MDPGLPDRAVRAAVSAISRLRIAARGALASIGALLLLPCVAVAHPGPPPVPGELLTSWNWDPWVLLGLGISATLYSRGVLRLWERAGVGRGIPRWRLHCFSAGLLALAVALISPVDAFGRALFSAHMVQHELLMLVGAPLLVLGAPWLAFLWAIPSAWRRPIGAIGRVGTVRRAGAILAYPGTAWVVYAVTLWAWHIPSLYQATLRSDPIHAVQHLSFVAAAFLFWWVLLHPGRSRRTAYGTGIVYVFTTAVHGSVLSALLTFSRSAWYPAYEEPAAAWNLTLLEDQHLAGLIMWVPPGFVYLAATVTVLGLWLREIERRAEQRPLSTSELRAVR